MAVLLLFAVFLLGTGARGQNCNASSQSSAADFPGLPSQYSTTVQAALTTNVQGGAATTTEYVVREYLDEVNNRGRLEVASRGDYRYAVYDSNLQRDAFVIDADGECTLYRDVVASHSSHRLGIRVGNDTVLIGTISHLLRHTMNNSTFSWYTSGDIVRGITCDRWQFCIEEPGATFTIDYYFSQNSPDWIPAYGKAPVPVQITINGVALNSESSFHNLSNVYTFAAFNGGSDSVPEDLFMIPTGTSCRGRELGKPYPTLPNYFSTFIEVADTNGQGVRVYKEYYDADQELFRVDFYSSGRRWPEGPLTLIRDFNLETEYIVNRELRNCTVTPIEPEATFSAVVREGRARLASSRQLLLFTNEGNFSYEGVSTVRGVTVESWIFYRDFEGHRYFNLTDVIYEIFFTHPNWSISTPFSPSSPGPLLWQTKISGVFTYYNTTTNMTQSENFTDTFDYFGFNSGEPDLDEFDTSVCSPANEHYRVVLMLPIEGITVDYSVLHRNVRSAVAGFTGVQPLQIGDIEAGGNSTALYVSFRMSNLSNVSLSIVPSPVTADEAVDKLISSAEDNNNKLGFMIEMASGIKLTPILRVIWNESAAVFHTSRNDCAKDTTSTTSDCETCLSEGAIAGIALWMLILGIGIGIVGTMCTFALISRRRRGTFSFTRGVPYKKQEEDVVVSTT